MPKVSVIVPIYNVEKYLHRCIDSILAQTFTDFELILVDDDSTDNCGAICDEYAAKDSRIRVIHQENGGVAAARNAGMDVAQGANIAFCDSDDYWDDDFLQTMVDAIKDSNADVVLSNLRMVGSKGTILKRTNHSSKTGKIESPESKYRHMACGILAGKYGWEVCTRFFRSDIIRRNHIRFCTSCENYAEDLGFVLQYCLYADSFCSIDYCGYNYYLRDNSMMRSSAAVVKLDQVNEVSRHVGEEYIKQMPVWKKRFPLIHFLIMWTEYQKLVGTPEYCKLPKETKEVKNCDWWKKQTRGIWFCSREAEKFFGKRIAHQILLLSHFCLHGNWKRFGIESAIAYRWLIK